MEMSVIVGVLAAAGGGLFTEMFRAWRGSKKDNLDLFYPTWQAEMVRLQTEVVLQRVEIVALGKVLLELGADPLAVRVALEDRINSKQEVERKSKREE